MADTKTPSPDSDEKPQASPGAADAVAREDEPPGYDTDKKGYRGISAGPLDHIDEVRAARNLAEMIVDTVREGLLVLDFDLRVQAANESFYDTFCAQPEETIGHLVYDLGNGQWDLPELRELLEDILPREKVFNDYEVAYDFETIGERVMLLNARQLDDHALILLAIEDVTERRRSERALRQSEEQYRALFGSMNEGFCIIEVYLDEDERGVDYRFLAANLAFERHTGLVDAVGKTARELVPDLEDRWPLTYGRVAVTGESEHFVMGSEAMGRWFEVDAFRIGAPEDRRVALLFTDVSERKQAEASLSGERARLETVLDTLPIGLIIADARGRIVRLNAATRELWGLPPETDSWEEYGEWVGWWPATGERIRAEEWAMARALLHGEVTRGELVQNQKFDSEERRYFLNSAAPVRDAEGRVTGGVVAMLDVTARVGMEAELRELNEELEARVEERTRQVRELSRSLTLAEQAERQRIAYVLHDDLQQILVGAKMAVSTDAQRVDAILDKAIDLTRTLSHELSPPLLKGEGLADLFYWLAERKRERYGLEVEVEVREGALIPEADLRILVYQIARELLFNVAKHAETKRARVLAERAGEFVHIVVEDEGAGFDPVALAKAGNTGLGLPSVRERLELVGGWVDVDSVPGVGTRVTMGLPLRPA